MSEPTVRVSGIVLASLMFQHFNSDSDVEGLVLGESRLDEQVTISDSQSDHIHIEEVYNVQKYVACGRLNSLYSGGGQVNTEALQEMLTQHKQGGVQRVLGWYRQRRNSEQLMTLRERLVHAQLKEALNNPHLLFMLLTPSRLTPAGATHRTEYSAFISRSRRLVKVPLLVHNLGLLEQQAYWKVSAPCCAAGYSLTMRRHGAQFFLSGGQLREVGEMDKMNEALQAELQAACSEVELSERRLEALQEELAALRRRVGGRAPRPPEEAAPPPPRSNLRLREAIRALLGGGAQGGGARGHVFLVGTANAGKSTLFNTLLQSDLCKTRAAVPKATVSPWPGTTLSLLRFPLLNPTPYRLLRRRRRLLEEEQQEAPPEELRRLQLLRRHGYLVGRVGHTFRAGAPRTDEVQFDPDSLAFGEDDEPAGSTPRPPTESHDGLSWNELKDARWLLDTPGILRQQDVLELLQDQEVQMVVPTRALVPRTFVLKPGMTLFVGALARIDFLEGGKSCSLSVLASSRVPVRVTSLEKADEVYAKHAGHALLGVPAGGAQRMQDFPALAPQDVRLEGRGHLEAAADITLSSAGWVAVAAAEGQRLLLRVHGPPGAGFGLRTPPLLPHAHRALNAPPHAHRALNAPPHAHRALKAVQEAKRTLKAPPDAQRTLKASQDTHRTLKAPPDAQRALKASQDTHRTPKAPPDAQRTLKAPPDAQRTLKAAPDTQRTLKAPPHAQKLPFRKKMKKEDKE